MHQASRARFGWAFLSLLLTAAPARAVSGEKVELCDPDQGKGELCGHAMADRARFEAGLAPRAGVSAAALEAQDDTDITHCFLDFEVLFSPNSIAGSNTLDVTSLSDGLSEFTLDLQSNMTVDEVRVNGGIAGYTRSGNQIVIALGGSYNAGQTFVVKVTYHGTPLNRTDFFSSPQYFFTTHNGNSIASSLSQPYQANYWWPCKENWGDANTPMDDKFTMDMWVTVPGTMIVASNGLLQGTDTLSGNRLRYRWHEEYPIATYLVSFAATNYSKLTYYYNHAGGDMPVEFYIYPEKVAESEPYLPTVVQAIAAFSDPSVYGQYPFIDEKYGIAQFAWCCGMEHQTMTSQGAFTSEDRNVHELAHQWWGDNVTCRTWHDVWLNEGFATFSVGVWREKRPGGSLSAYHSYIRSKKPSTNGTGTVYRYDLSSSDAIFSTTYSYNKGAWVVHMLRHVLGDANFFASLAAYRSAYAGSVADTEEFRAVCEATCGMPSGSLAWFFDQWVYNPGALYYRYGWEQEQIGSQKWVRLHVEQYQRTISSSFPNTMKMPIDITLTTASGSQTHVIWNDVTGTGSTVREWFLLPADGTVTGVQLDKDQWILRDSPASRIYVKGPPKIINVAPEIGSRTGATPGLTAVQVQFSEAVNVAASDLTLTGSRTGPQAFTLSYSAALYTATLQFSQPLAGGQTFTLGVAATVKSQAALIALDGEIANPASLPSGDGVAGGDAVITFRVGSIGDFDVDDSVDLDDFAHLQACASGANVPLAPACLDADLDRDNDVDQDDFGVLQRCFTVAEVLPDPACAD